MAADLWERLSDSLLLEIMNRVQDAESIMSMRQCCKRARTLSGLVEELDLQFLKWNETAECRLVRTVALCGNIKHLSLSLSEGTSLHFSSLCLMSILERVKDSLITFNFCGTDSDEQSRAYSLPPQALRELVESPNLRSLVLTNVDLRGFAGPESLLGAHKLGTVTKLSLGPGQANTQSVNLLLSLCPSLETLDLKELFLGNEDTQLDFSHLPKLTKLTFTYAWNNEGLLTFQGLDGCPNLNLRHLELSSAFGAIPIDAAQFVCLLLKAKNLEVLRLGENSIGGGDAAVAYAARCIANSESLRRLEITDTFVLVNLFWDNQVDGLVRIDDWPLPEVREFVLILPVDFCSNPILPGILVDSLRYLQNLKFLVLKPLGKKPGSLKEMNDLLVVGLERAFAFQRALPGVSVQVQKLQTVDRC